MNNQQFDNLISEITTLLSDSYLNILSSYPIFNKTVDTSPLLNLTLSVFMSSLINILDGIKKYTIGEVELMKNIELSKEYIIKAFENLPFIKSVEVKKS